ncbi:MAG: glycosyltransferase [Mycoplasmataceae bacterium]|nr:glycosyltransferase [Mycoplasmataceae bacterium]
MKIIYIINAGFSSYLRTGGLEKYLREIYDDNINLNFVEISKQYSNNPKYMTGKRDNVFYNTPEKFYHNSNGNLDGSDSHTDYTDYIDYFNDYFNHINNSIIILNFSILKLKKINRMILFNNDIFFVDHGMTPSYLFCPTKSYYTSSKIKIDKRFNLLKSKFILRIDKYRTRKKWLPIREIKIIVYTEENKKIWMKYYNFRDDQFIIIPLSSTRKQLLTNNELNSFATRKYDLGYLGRYDQIQKNLKLANGIIERSKKSALFAGYDFPASPASFYLKSKYINNIFYWDRDPKLFYSQVKYTIHTSRFEGFGYSLLESMENGVPVILLNSFPAAKYIVGENNERGFLFKNKKQAIHFIRSKANNEELWRQKSQSCSNWIKSEQDNFVFKKEWKKILNNEY